MPFDIDDPTCIPWIQVARAAQAFISDADHRDLVTPEKIEEYKQRYDELNAQLQALKDDLGDELWIELIDL